MKAISKETKDAIIEALRKEQVETENTPYYEGKEFLAAGFAEAISIVESFHVSDGWIPVSERNPNERGHYLVYFPNGDMSTARFDPRYVEENKWMWSKANGYLPPSHYKPLPNPPTSHK